MAERQYIGARYVPKFFENPVTGDTTWASGVIYEPLTIVTWMNNSYTSKKRVPAGIGAPNIETDYWVATGLYNAQVDELRQNVELLNAKFPIESDSIDDDAVTIDKINKGITIIISDSYGYQPALSTSWVAILAKKLGIASDSDTFNYGTNIVNDNLITSIYGSRGFGTDSLAHPATFKDQLTDAIALVENTDDIVRIIVCGGTNDMADYNSTKIINGINAFCTLANSLKNAKTYCGMIGNLLDDTYPTDNYQNVDYLYSLGDYIFMDGLECIQKLRSNMSADGQHPNTNGASMIGKAIYNILEAGSLGVWDFSMDENASFTDGTNTITVKFRIKFNKNTTNVIIREVVADIPKPARTYVAELDNMAFTGIPITHMAMGIAPANNQSGECLIAMFRMMQPDTAYKGKLELSLFGSASNTGNFMGQTIMTIDSHSWH